MSGSAKPTPTILVDAPPRDVELEVTLGLGPEDAVLRLEQGSRRQDLQPWLLDAVAAKIVCLGHHDEVPRPWDWENVLTSLEPGEELLYVLDHHAADSGSRAGTFDLWLAIRFPPCAELDEKALDLREKRARVLISQVHRQAFPGSEVEWIEPHALLGRLGTSTGPEERCIVVTGMPSPRSLSDDARDIDREAVSRNYQSLNDVVEALYDLGCDYRIAFVVQRVGVGELQTSLTRMTALYDRIHPLVEVSKKEGENWAKQWGENRSFAEAVGENIAKQGGTSKGTTFNAGSAGMAAGAGIGFMVSGPPGAAVGAALGALAGMVSVNRGTSSSVTEGRSWTHTFTTGTNTSETSGVSRDQTVQHVSSLLRLADGSLNRTISAIHEAYGTGGFRWGAFAFTEGQNAEIVGRSLMGVLAGSRTKDHPLVRFEVLGERDRLLASRTSAMELVAEAAPILSLPRVCDALLVPEAELPGLRLRRNVFLGRNVDTNEGGSGAVVLGPDAFSAIGAESAPADIRIPTSDLFKHILVAGTTGSGKTTRVVEILNRLDQPQLSVVVFETAKRTYRTRLQRHGRPAPLVYNLGSSTSYGPSSRFRPFRLNPFYFELGTSLKRHIAVLSDALAELMPTEAMIGPLMRRAVEACFDERGWDIESGRPRGDAEPTWPTVVDFVVHVRDLASRLTYGQEVNANYRGALDSRAGLFLDATFQDIFGYGGNTPIDELFPPDLDAIIEVEDLPPSDVDVRAFVMTLILSRLRAVQGARQGDRQGSASTPAPEGSCSTEPALPRPLEKILRDYFSGKVPRPGKYVKGLLRNGKVRVDGQVVRVGNQLVGLGSIIKAGDVVVAQQSAAATPVGTEVGSPVERQVLDEQRQWLLVIEEAHNVLDRQFEQRRPADESNAGRTLLRSVVRLLQEGREMGIGVMVIDQSPTKLARDVIGNTGTKVTMRLEDADEMAEVGRAMGLDEDAWQKLGFLQVGEALVKTSYMDRPAKSAGFPRFAPTSDPAERLPTGDNWSPSFADLASVWSPVVAGKGSEPDDAWTTVLLARTAGDRHLAMFAGLRALLVAGVDKTSDDATTLRRVLAKRHPTDGDLTSAAKDLWAAAVRRFYSEEMARAAALICRAVAPSAAWRVDPMSADGVMFVAGLLADSGLRDRDGWSWALTQAQGPQGSTRGCAALAALALECGGGDRTIAIRMLLTEREELQAIRTRSRAMSPGALVVNVGHAVSSALPLEVKGVPPAEQAVAEALLAEIEERLARQVAAAVGSVYTQEVADFFSHMSRFA